MTQQSSVACGIVLFCGALSGCVRASSSIIPDGPPGSLIVIASDSVGKARQWVNAYFVEDPRITTQTILQNQAGAWTDERGVASLGSWRPGRYTLSVQAPGFKKQVHRVTIRAGRIDTLRVSLRNLNMLLEEGRKHR